MVLDELVVELGLDPSKFNEGQKQALEAFKRTREEARSLGSDVESQGAKTTEFFMGLKREALGLVGLFLGGRGITEFVQHITTLDAQTGRLARTMNMSARDLSTWQGAATQAGGSAEGISSALQGATTDMNKFMLTGQGTLASVLRPLGVSIFDNNQRLKTAGDLFLELADAAQKIGDPARAAAYLSLIPGMNQETINLLLQGRSAVQGLLREAREAGGTTAESAAEAVENQKSLALLERTAESTGRTLLTSLLPSLVAVLNQLRAAVKGGTDPTGGKSLWDFLTTVPEVHVIPGSLVDVYRRGLAGEYRSFRELWEAPKNSTTFASPAVEDARSGLGAGLRSRAQGGGNWQNFLSGLSFLETSQTGAPSGSSTARGYFQFLQGTADRAQRAGIGDPRQGGYSDQAQRTRQYIQTFYPAAAEAIERGDFSAASQMLRGEWPSLPGGSQPQSADRYRTFSDELRGGGPRPPGQLLPSPGRTSQTNNTHITIGSISLPSVREPRDFPEGLRQHLDRTAFAAQADYGLTG